MMTTHSSLAANIIRRAGLRPSPHRVAVLDYVLSRRNHPTADIIFRDLSAKLPSLARTTVYNVIHSLSSAGLLFQVEGTTDDAAHFDASPLPPHSHLVCSRCGAIVDIPLAPPAPPKIAEANVTGVKLIFTGFCNHCAAAADK